MEQYIYGLGMLMEDLCIDTKGRIFILIDGIDEQTGKAVYKDVFLPEEYQTFGNVEIIKNLKLNQHMEEASESWTDRPEYDENGEPNE